MSQRMFIKGSSAFYHQSVKCKIKFVSKPWLRSSVHQYGLALTRGSGELRPGIMGDNPMKQMAMIIKALTAGQDRACWIMSLLVRNDLPVNYQLKYN